MTVLNPQPMPLNAGGPQVGAAQDQQTKPPLEGLERGMEVLKRMEPGIEMLPIEFSAASIAVSLRDISTQLHRLCTLTEQGNVGQGMNLQQIIETMKAGNLTLSGIREATDRIAKAKRDGIQEALSRIPF